MNILIIEPESKGHYIILYIKYLVKILLKLNHNVVFLTTRRSTNHISFKSVFKNVKNINYEFIDDLKPKNNKDLHLLLYQIKYFKLIKTRFKELNIKYNFNFIFLNSFDHFDKALSLFGSPFQNVDFGGIFVNIKFHFGEYNLGRCGRYVRISKFLFRKLLAIKNLKFILSNDIFFLKFVKTKNFLNYKKIKYLNEFREFSDNFKKKYARKKLGLPNKSKLVLIYGALKKSKGIEKIVEILKDKNLDQNIKVVMAGEQDQDIKRFLSKKNCKKLISDKKIFILKGFQDEYNESLIFSAVDIVWIGYDKSFPFVSGVLYQAVAMGLPIITCDHGLIGFTNKSFKLGPAVDINNDNEIICSLNNLCKKQVVSYFIKRSKQLKKKISPKLFVNQIKTLLSYY
jgi:glycosyltransferase involved in cell wall biosynthesis